LSCKWTSIGVLLVFTSQINIPVNDPSFWWLLIILLIIGLIAIIVIGFLLAFPIAGVAAILVFFLTGSLLYAGITFLFVALIVAAIGQAADIGHQHSEHEHSNEHED
jgi:membrane protein implicated in regulation of membrane protease activity